MASTGSGSTRATATARSSGNSSQVFHSRRGARAGEIRCDERGGIRTNLFPMNHEQLAFFNQQLAAMLKSGLPLESSLKQLSASMQRGRLRDEIQQLETDLEQGSPLDEALGRRKLPELYVAML